MGCLLRVLMRPCGLAWVVVWMVVCVVGSSGSTDRPSHLSSDPQVNTARALIEGGRFDEALVILRPIAPGHADRIDALFLVGLAALGAAEAADDERRDGLLDEAIGAFHAILVERPELVRVRLELARAFFLKGEDDLSRRHFERVLAGNPHPAVAANIMRFLGAIRERRRWRGYVGVSLAPGHQRQRRLGCPDHQYLRPALRARFGVGSKVGGGNCAAGRRRVPVSAGQ